MLGTGYIATAQAAVTGQVDVKLNVSTGCTVEGSTINGDTYPAFGCTTEGLGILYDYPSSNQLGIDMGICKDEDIVVFASDDFVPPTNWDKLESRCAALAITF